MIYHECIRVQTTQAPDMDSNTGPWAAIQEELDKLGPQRSSIFTRIDQPQEVMVLLRRDRKSLDPRGSRVARLLVFELKKLGLVNYSAWVERGEPKAEERSLQASLQSKRNSLANGGEK